MNSTQYEQIMSEVKAEYKEWLKEKARERVLVKQKGNKIRQATLDEREAELDF